MQHIPWFSAIETGLSRQADLNRFILLELGDIPVEARGKIRLPSREMRDLGQRLLAVGLRFLPEAQRLAEVLRGEQFEGVPGRVVEGFSVPWAIYSAISGAGDVLATESLRRMFEEWDFTEQAERDEVNVLSEILTSEVQMDGGAPYHGQQAVGRIERAWGDRHAVALAFDASTSGRGPTRALAVCGYARKWSPRTYSAAATSRARRSANT